MIIVYSSDGKIEKTLSVNNDDDISINVPQDMFYIEAFPEKSIADYYVENSFLVEKPLKPNGFYKFNYITKQWDPDPDQAAIDVLEQRLIKLQESDWTDTASAVTRLTNYKQWQDYRQALREIPQQSGYPLNVIWPEQP